MRLLAESGVGGLGAFRGDCGGVLGVDVSGVFSAKRAASAVRPSTVNLNVVSVSLLSSVSREGAEAASPRIQEQRQAINGPSA